MCTSSVCTYTIIISCCLPAVRSEADILDNSVTFAPVFTHQVFGENEAIFGYKDLKVKLYYTPDTLSTYIGLKYTSQSDSPKPDNVVKVLSEYIPKGDALFIYSQI